GPGPVAQEGQADGHDQQRQQRLVVDQQGGDDQAVGDAGGPVGGRPRGRPQPALREPLAGGEADHDADQGVVDQEEGGHGDHPDHGQGRPEHARPRLAAEQVVALQQVDQGGGGGGGHRHREDVLGDVEQPLDRLALEQDLADRDPDAGGDDQHRQVEEDHPEHDHHVADAHREAVVAQRHLDHEALGHDQAEHVQQGLPGSPPTTLRLQADGGGRVQRDDDRGRGHDRQDQQPGG